MSSNIQITTIPTKNIYSYTKCFILLCILSHKTIFRLASANIFDNKQNNNNLNGNELGDLDLYKIVWKGPLNPLQEALNNGKYSEDNIIHMSTKTQQKYKCFVPDSNIDQLNFDSSAKNSSIDDVKAKNPFQMLEPLFKSEICSIKSEIFWIYELCHGKHLRQFHSEGPSFTTKITQEYYLGTIDSEQLEILKQRYNEENEELERTGSSRPTILVDGQHKPFVTYNMTGGTKCDLTDRNRISRIVYVCNEGTKHELYSIKEVSTCEYEAIVLSPLLCQHKDFKSDTNTYDIECYSLDGSPDKPTNLIEADEDGNTMRKGEIAYFMGRTLIIDADLILS